MIGYLSLDSLGSLSLYQFVLLESEASVSLVNCNFKSQFRISTLSVRIHFHAGDLLGILEDYKHSTGEP